MFRQTLLFSLALTTLLLLIFISRQLLVSLGFAAGQFDLASELVFDFLTSKGAMLDLARFVIGLILLHGVFALLVALAAYPFSKMATERKVFKSVMFVIFSIFTICVLAWVSLFYPLTLAGFLKYSPLSNLTFAIALTLVCAVLVTVGIFVLFRHKRLIPASLGLAVLLFLVTSSYFDYGAEGFSANKRAHSGNSQNAPNIVIIGVDALRPDHLGINGFEPQLTPEIDEFLSQSIYFEQAFTPIARTYTAWFSLLSGQSPKSTGVRYNLQPFDEAQITGSELQNILKEQGYHTIYGMDERRFNNIDERYGFDQDVGPDFGAADFVLFHAAELPLVALVSNTVFGKWLFPMIYSNRGVHGTYMPETFTKEVLRTTAARPQKPLFLALHLTLPHWPFLYREFEPDDRIEFDGEHKFHYAYQLMLKEVDFQFSKLMAGLEKQGVLNNSLVFLVSDHGESFMLDQDALKPGNAELSFPTSAHGHGTSVLDEKQYHVVLGMQDRRAGDGHSASSATHVKALVSLLDIAPTIADALNLELPAQQFEGDSLLRIAECSDCEARNVFIESSIATGAMFEEGLDMVKVVAQGLGYYTVSPDGSAVVRDEVETLLALKQRAVVNEDYIVALFPGLKQDFLIVDREKGVWWPSSRYGGGRRGDVLGLINQLCQYYKSDVSFDKNKLCRGAAKQ